MLAWYLMCFVYCLVYQHVFAGGGRWGYGSYGRGRENYSGAVKNTHKRFDSNDYSGEYRI
jgi:hypothetical protein